VGVDAQGEGSATLTLVQLAHPDPVTVRTSENTLLIAGGEERKLAGSATSEQQERETETDGYANERLGLVARRQVRHR
jgi:hypothetical protein